MANTPYPQLQIQPLSGLSFAWAEYHPDPVVGSMSATLGSDGVMVGMKMLVFWADLGYAVTQLLGYSKRTINPSTLKPQLQRYLPWQHPYWNQLYVKRIAEVRGIRQEGKGGGSGTDQEDNFNVKPIGTGAGYTTNLGPWTEYHLAELTLQFWRPPYFVRSDNDILDMNGNPQEWLRYVDKHWEQSLNMLSRENSTFQWLPAQSPYSPTSQPFTGSVGQTVTHMRVSRTWYQIPEQALFASLVDAAPNGLPSNMVYTQTATENPISKFDQACGSVVTTTTVGTSVAVSITNATTTSPNAGALLSAAGYTYPVGSPIGGCVNAPIGGFAVDGAGNWVDSTIASRFFGCYSGTLRFDGVTFTPQPLQLPAYLMEIPLFGTQGNEAISQVQYDVTFHFDLFDPPPGTNYVDPSSSTKLPLKGHNLFPWSGNGLWFPLLSQKDGANPPGSGPKLTPFQYCDMTDLFRIL